MPPEKGPDRSAPKTEIAPKALTDSERRLEATINELNHLDDNPDALAERLDAAINQANDDCLGEAVTLISYGANHLASLLEQIGVDPAQCEAVKAQYDQLVNPNRFTQELMDANRLQEARTLASLQIDARASLDHRYQEYNSILDQRIGLYEQDIATSEENKKALQGDVDAAQGELDTLMVAFNDSRYGYGLDAEKALTANDQELFNLIYTADFGDQPEPATEAEQDRVRETVRTRRDMLKARIAPLQRAQAAVREVNEKITAEDRNIEANKQWIAQSKAEREPFKRKYEADKQAVDQGTYTAEGNTESLAAKARRLATGDRGREEVNVIQQYVDLASNASDTLLRQAARSHLDRTEQQLIQRVARLTQGIEAFRSEEPSLARTYDSERNRLQGLLYQINPSKHQPPDLLIA